MRLIFQSTIKTLSDLEIQNAVEEILDPIINFKDVTIPGLKLIIEQFTIFNKKM